MTTPRFGLIPLPISQKDIATNGEFLVDPNNGHIYLKKSDGTVISKTVELENRLNAFIAREELTNSIATIPGRRLPSVMNNTSEITLSTTSQVAKVTPTDGKMSTTLVLDNLALSYSANYIYYVMVRYTTPLAILGSPTIYAKRCNWNSNNVPSGDIITGTPVASYLNADNTGISDAEFTFSPSLEASSSTLIFHIDCMANIEIKEIVIFKKPLYERDSLNSHYMIDYRSEVNEVIPASYIDTNINKIVIGSAGPLKVKSSALTLKDGRYSVAINCSKGYNDSLHINNYTGKLSVTIVKKDNTTIVKTVDFSKIPTYSVNGDKLATIELEWVGSQYKEIQFSTSVINFVRINNITFNAINTALYEHSRL